MRSWSGLHSRPMRAFVSLAAVCGMSVLLNGAPLTPVPTTVREARETARRLIVGAYPELRGLNAELRFPTVWRLDTPVHNDVTTWLAGEVWPSPPGSARGPAVRPAWWPQDALQLLSVVVVFVDNEHWPMANVPKLSVSFRGRLVDELSEKAGRIRWDDPRGQDRATLAAAFTQAGAKYGPHAKEAFRTAVQVRIEGLADVLGPLDVKWVTFNADTAEWVVDFETRSEPVTQYWMKCEPFEGRPLFIGERRKR